MAANETTIFMAVTNDTYELPLAVADTLKQLCKMMGLRYESVLPRVRKETEPVVRLGGGKTAKIVKTKI